MKTSRLIAVGAVGVAALWTAGWFAGRSLYVEPEAQRVVDKLRAGDIFFTYERRTIGGFPVAYDVAYEGVSLSSASTLWRWSLPRLSVGSGLVDSGVVTLRPASESKLIIESAALSGQDGAEPVVFDIRVDAPLITLTGDDEQAAVMLRASGLSAKQTAGDAPLSDARIQLDELALDARLAGAGKDGKLTATALEIAYTFSPDMVSETSTTINVADLAIGFTGEALDAADFAEFVSRDGAARATIATGRYEIASAGSGGPSQPPYELEFGAGSSETIASIREGRARYEIDSTELLYAMERDPPAGGATVDAFSMMLDMPIRRGAAPYQLTLSVDGVKPDDAFWSVTDATGSLPRTPMALNLEFAGTARILADLGAELQSAADRCGDAGDPRIPSRRHGAAGGGDRRARHRRRRVDAGWRPVARPDGRAGADRRSRRGQLDSGRGGAGLYRRGARIRAKGRRRGPPARRYPCLERGDDDQRAAVAIGAESGVCTGPIASVTRRSSVSSSSSRSIRAVPKASSISR